MQILQKQFYLRKKKILRYNIMTNVIPELIHGGEPAGQASGFTSGAAEYNATGGRRRRGTRKSRGNKRKSVGGKGSRRKTAKKGKKSGKSRKSKSNRRK
jgi:hypothetical protein